MKMPILQTGNQDAGFTMLEIIIIMVIIGVALAILTPAFNNYLQGIEVKTDQRKVINLLEVARNKAITTGKEQVVGIKNGNLVILKPDEKEETLEVKTTALWPIEGSQEITFYPDGTSSGGSFLFTYQDTGKLILSINQVTGKPLWDEVN